VTLSSERLEPVVRRVRADRVALVVHARRQHPRLVLARRAGRAAGDVAIAASAGDVGRQPDRDLYNVVELEQRDALGLGTVTIVVRRRRGLRGRSVGLRATAGLGGRRDRSEGAEDRGDRGDQAGETVHGRWLEQSPCHA
jgi:hypothetical protein